MKPGANFYKFVQEQRALIGGSESDCIVGAFLDIWGALWIGALGSIAGHECLLSPWASVLFGIMSPYVEYAQERV